MTVIAAFDYGSGSATNTTVPPWVDEHQPHSPGVNGPIQDGRLSLTPDIPGSVLDPNRPAASRVLRAELRPFSATNPGTETPPDGDVSNPGGYISARSEVLARLPTNPTLDASTYPDPPGSERWYAWSTFFPAGFEQATDETWLSFTQWKGWRGNSAPFFLGTRHDKIIVDGERVNAGILTGNVLGLIPSDKWVRFVVGVLWSPNSSTGWLEIRMNGKLVVPRKTMATMDTDGSGTDPVYLKQGIYQDHTFKQTHVLHFGPMLIADTRLDVDSDAAVLTKTTAAEQWH